MLILEIKYNRRKKKLYENPTIYNKWQLPKPPWLSIVAFKELSTWELKNGVSISVMAKVSFNKPSYCLLPVSEDSETIKWVSSFIPPIKGHIYILSSLKSRAENKITG